MRGIIKWSIFSLLTSPPLFFLSTEINAAEKLAIASESAEAREVSGSSHVSTMERLTAQLEKLTKELQTTSEKHREAEVTFRKKKDKVPPHSFRLSHCCCCCCCEASSDAIPTVCRGVIFPKAERDLAAKIGEYDTSMSAKSSEIKALKALMVEEKAELDALEEHFAKVDANNAQR
jgi:hypothetical protein